MNIKVVGYIDPNRRIDDGILCTKCRRELYPNKTLSHVFESNLHPYSQHCHRCGEMIYIGTTDVTLFGERPKPLSEMYDQPSINLAKIERDVLARNSTPAKADPANTLEIERISDRPASTRYEVRVPPDTFLSDKELITRADNNRPDLTQDMGQVCHFGGNVTPMSTDAKGRTAYRVDVYTD